MVNFSNLIKFQLYFLSKTLFARILLVFTFIMIVLFGIFVHTTESGDMNILFIDEQLSYILINSVFSFFVPVYLFLYLFSCLLIVEHLYDSTIVKSLLAKKVSRLEQLLSIYASQAIIVIFFTITGLLIYSKFYDFNLILGIQVALFHFLLLTQVLLLAGLGVSKNLTFLFYILFLIILPLFLKNIITGLFFASGYFYLGKITESIFYLISSHLELLSEIGGVVMNQNVSSHFLPYLLYIFLVNLCVIILFLKKEFN